MSRNVKECQGTLLDAECGETVELWRGNCPGLIQDSKRLDV
jgi:hypothetical protein